VNAGTLLVNGALTANTSTVTVHGGATLGHSGKPSGGGCWTHPSFPLSSHLEDVFADLALDSSEDATLTRSPRRSRLQRYERDADAWFAGFSEFSCPSDPSVAAGKPAGP
jgi:hypothetical protein